MLSPTLSTVKTQQSRAPAEYLTAPRVMCVRSQTTQATPPIGMYAPAALALSQEAEAWLLLLLEMLPVLPAAQLLEAVLPVALAQGQVNEPVLSRVSGCRLLGGMAPHLVGVVGAGQQCSQSVTRCSSINTPLRHS